MENSIIDLLTPKINSFTSDVVNGHYRLNKGSIKSAYLRGVYDILSTLSDNGLLTFNSKNNV